MDTLNFEQIGEKLKKIRLSKNLTQEYIANAADVNTSHISNIENNRVKVSLSVLVQICNALDTTVDYILSDEYNDSSSAIEQEILLFLLPPQRYRPSHLYLRRSPGPSCPDEPVDSPGLQTDPE